MDLWLCWFVVLHGGFHGGAGFGSFVAGLVVVFSGGVVRGGWYCFSVKVNGGFVVVNGSFCDSGGSGVDLCGGVCGC